jgi:hypothetical protein
LGKLGVGNGVRLESQLALDWAVLEILVVYNFAYFMLSFTFCLPPSTIVASVMPCSTLNRRVTGPFSFNVRIG